MGNFCEGQNFSDLPLPKASLDSSGMEMQDSSPFMEGIFFLNDHCHCLVVQVSSFVADFWVY